MAGAARSDPLLRSPHARFLRGLGRADLGRSLLSDRVLQQLAILPRPDRGHIRRLPELRLRSAGRAGTPRRRQAQQPAGGTDHHVALADLRGSRVVSGAGPGRDDRARRAAAVAPSAIRAWSWSCCRCWESWGRCTSRPVTRPTPMVPSRAPISSSRCCRRSLWWDWPSKSWRATRSGGSGGGGPGRARGPGSHGLHGGHEGRHDRPRGVRSGGPRSGKNRVQVASPDVTGASRRRRGTGRE